MGRMIERKRKNELVSGSKRKKKKIDREGEEAHGIIMRHCQSNIRVGDSVNLSHLLFTQTRDYLVRYNQNTQEKADDLAGKVVVLLFVSLVYGCDTWRKLITHLLDIYSKLHPTRNFEMVFVAVRDDATDEETPAQSTPGKRFLQRFSTMPWPAIPFSDLKSRKRLETIFGIRNGVDLMPRSYVIDHRGVVMQRQGNPLFFRYGAAAYPFTNERIEFLDSEDNVAKIKPSMTNLFSSPDSDYLIDNKGNQVPLRNLENKVVALYFCPDLFDKCFTMKLKMAYEELSKNKEDFEVVLIYTHGWWDAYPHTDEDSFWKAFKTMPWLALPFEDTNSNKKLQRIFKYPQELLGLQPNPRLVIIGPHGEFSEPLGANILLKYGVTAYPFTISKVANLELEMVKKVKPEMLWDLDAIFMNENTSQVRFSQLVGKRIMVLLQDRRSKLDCTLRELKVRYLKMKGTTDEFEVIHICSGEQSMRIAAAMPWLVYPCFDENTYAHEFIKSVFYGNYYGLLAFDHEGAVVRRALFPVVGDNMVFPFHYEGNMKNEVLEDLKHIFKDR